MTDNELALLKKELAKCTSYLEFGSGNSTQLAVRFENIRQITVVESSSVFFDEHVACHQEVSDAIASGRLKKLLIDIGPTKIWGYPADNSRKSNWPSYSQQAFSEGVDYDLLLVDGRFRVACVLNACLKLKPGTKILIHDFFDRPHYWVVRKFLNEQAGVDTLALFTIKDNNNPQKIKQLLKKYQYRPGDKGYFGRLNERICNKFWKA